MVKPLFYPFATDPYTPAELDSRDFAKTPVPWLWFFLA